MRTNKYWLLLLTMIIAVSVNGCFYYGIRGNGNVTSQERPGSGFSGILVIGAAKMNIHIAESYRITVTTDSNIQDALETKVVNNVLRITTKSRRGFNPTTLLIDVYMPEVTNITVSGAADVLIAEGQTSSLKIALRGAGKINAEDYEAQNVDINLSGAGEITTWAVSALDYQLSGVGRIGFRGTPTLKGNISGLGKIGPL